MSKYEPDHDDRALEDAFIRWQAEQYSDAGTLEATCPLEDDKTDYRTGAEYLEAIFARYSALDADDLSTTLAHLGEGMAA